MGDGWMDEGGGRWSKGGERERERERDQEQAEKTLISQSTSKPNIYLNNPPPPGMLPALANHHRRLWLFTLPSPAALACELCFDGAVFNEMWRVSFLNTVPEAR